MSSISVSLIVFACIFGGAVLGMHLHTVLPEHHLRGDSNAFEARVLFGKTVGLHDLQRISGGDQYLRRPWLRRRLAGFLRNQ